MPTRNLPFVLFYNGKRHWHHNNFCHKDNWEHKARLKINNHFNFKSVSHCRTATKLLILCARWQPDQSYLAIWSCRGVEVSCEQHHAKVKEKAVVFAGGRNITGLLQREHTFGQNSQALWLIQPATRTFSRQVLCAIWATRTPGRSLIAA